jgi:hypothetical protein
MRMSDTVIAGEEIHTLNGCGVMKNLCLIIIEKLNEAAILREEEKVGADSLSQNLRSSSATSPCCYISAIEWSRTQNLEYCLILPLGLSY